jgi:hypothetical protein
MPLKSFAVIIGGSFMIFQIAVSFKLEPDSPPAGMGSQAVRAADGISKRRVEIVDDEHAPVN